MIDVWVKKWHLEVLAAREELVRQGKARFSPWTETKKRLPRKFVYVLFSEIIGLG